MNLKKLLRLKAASGGGTKTEVIIPEQTITVSKDGTKITNKTGTIEADKTYICTVNGESKTITAAAQYGGIICWYVNQKISFENYNGTLYFGVYDTSMYGDFTIKVEKII